MATYDDDDEGLEDEGEVTGKGLRAQLEAALKNQRKLESKLSTYEVTDFLVKKGFDLVEVSDLAGVDPSDREEKAKALQDQRTESQRTLLRKALAKQGLEGDALEDLVNETVASHAAKGADAEAVARARRIGQLDSSPVPAVNPDELHGGEAIRFALEHNAKNNRKQR